MRISGEVDLDPDSVEEQMCETDTSLAGWLSYLKKKKSELGPKAPPHAR